ncbi:MAG: DUF4505 domain-containing protein [Ignavibacteria bacterium]|nr:DUF4505 domain-containing protein [Ignavibacteria bacterium]
MRDYYYDLDERGTLTLDGVVQDDPWFLDFFFRRLATNANPDYPEFRFVCRCGDEMNYLRPQDTPIVFSNIVGQRLMYGHSLSVHFEPEKLAYSEDGVLYHAAPVGNYGRIAPQAAVDIARQIQPWGPFYGYRIPNTGQIVPLEPLAIHEELQILRPKPENRCVGCGQANPWSLRLSFFRWRNNGVVRSWITPDERMQGAMGTTHGGFVSLLLDEVMGKSLSAKGIKAPTAQLLVNFRKPMKLGVEYELRSWIESQQGRKQFVRGEVRLSSNPDVVIAEANALFLEIKQPL